MVYVTAQVKEALEENQTKGQEIQVECVKCKGDTHQVVLQSVDIDGTEFVEGEGSSIDWVNNYQIIQCQGCKTVTFRERSWFSEHVSHDDDGSTETLYPPRCKKPAIVSSDRTKSHSTTSQFDVFLCHNSVDKYAVKEIGRKLRVKGLNPWLDEWELRPGFRWQKVLEEQIKSIKAVAVFVGDAGFGPWQDEEVDAYLRDFVIDNRPVIPVILGDCDNDPELPPFLGGRHWVDFRKSDPDPAEQLIYGITGERSGTS